MIKLSLILAAHSARYAGAARFEDLAERASDGWYDVRICPGAALSNGDQRTELEMGQSGALQASGESSILLSRFDPRFSVFSLPCRGVNLFVAARVGRTGLGELSRAVGP